MILYSVRDWAKHYETHETKKYKKLSWVPFTNRHDGRGFKRLMKRKDGGAIFGAFVLIVEVASRMEKRGVLQDDKGPWTPEDLETETGAPAALFAKALPVLSLAEHKIQWLVATEIEENLPASPGVPGSSGLASRTNRIEQNRIEQKENNVSCSEPETAPASEPPVPPELEMLDWYKNDKRLCKEWPDLLPAWKQAYPGVDISLEVAAAHAWEKGHPKRRKVDRPAFLTNWLKRSQDRPQQGYNRPPPNSEAARHTAASERNRDAEKTAKRKREDEERARASPEEQAAGIKACLEAVMKAQPPGKGKP